MDGLTLEDAQALAAVCAQPRPADEWLALIAELDAAIEAYCLAAGLPGDVLAHMMTARSSQSLASIPAALAWFKRELEAMHRESAPTRPAPTQPPQMNYARRDSAKAARLRLIQGGGYE
ncbi:hypothetical protein QN374_00720 [Herbaspirillum sp. RTI4]|uniref:hypothetical protein n=1 Tax=Herbaspirillum sp. RTI4 TaxID=3048640 RepID=UPI002B2354AD|nr:hypothetical protein [Herbaspirillum sp. RTI4]MEA9980352.1 hypothetical protein [Herbaspirillum sp. RTI4]